MFGGATPEKEGVVPLWLVGRSLGYCNLDLARIGSLLLLYRPLLFFQNGQVSYTAVGVDWQLGEIFDEGVTANDYDSLSWITDWCLQILYHHLLEREEL